jgi:C4-dicarboxylate transporter, DcuC family
MVVALGLLVIAAAVIAVVRNVDVRLALLLAALALGTLAGAPANIVRKFFQTLAAEEFLVPICAAMGFAHVLRHTRCDRHLVHLLTNPLRRVRTLLVPGAVLVGFVVNIPIISQTSTAVSVGSVLIPLLLAAGVSPVTAGSVLLLGASIGGELLNQGAPEFRTVVRETTALGLPLSGHDCVQAVLPLVGLHLLVSMLVLWGLSRRLDRQEDAAPTPVPSDRAGSGAPDPDTPFTLSYVKAMVPLVPLALLFVVAPPLSLLDVPQPWLVGPEEATNPFESRRVGLAMVVGTMVAALAARTHGTIGAFFEGVGFAVTNIISIIVAAACFGEGVKLLGLHRSMGDLIVAMPHLLLPVAGFFPLAFGFISGSGMAATQSLFGLFASPALSLGVAPEHVGAVVALGAAAGRTMSPVAAVTLMCASLTATRPTQLVRRVAVPLLAGMAAVAIAASLMLAAGMRKAPTPATPQAPAVDEPTSRSPRTPP